MSSGTPKENTRIGRDECPACHYALSIVGSCLYAACGWKAPAEPAEDHAGHSLKVMSWGGTVCTDCRRALLLNDGSGAGRSMRP